MKYFKTGSDDRMRLRREGQTYMKKGDGQVMKGIDRDGSRGRTAWNTRDRAMSMLVTAALVVTPLGGTAFVPSGSAFGEGPAASAPSSETDVLAPFPDEVRDLVKDYRDAKTTAEELADGLRLLQTEGRISLTELDALLILLDGGALDPSSGSTGGSNGGGAAPGVPDDPGTGADTGTDPGADPDPAPTPGDPGDGTTGDTATDPGTDPGTDDAGASGGAPAGPSAPADPSDPAAPAAPSDTSGAVAPTPGASGPAPSAGPAVQPAAPTPSRPGVVYPSSGTYVPHRSVRNLTTDKFIALVGEQARQIGQERNLYASVMIAQAILESASGNSELARSPYHNLFGIKGTWRDKGVDMLTQEDDGTGLLYTVPARFRAYDSVTDSLDDYADLLTKDSDGFYRGAWKTDAPSPARACDFLEGRYATSTSYSESLQDLIETYDLTRFDEPLGYEPVATYERPAVDEETGEAVLDDEGRPVMEKRTLADLVAEATSFLDTGYVWGASDPDVGFDCSGLVQYSYREALGIDLPRTTYEQWKLGQTVDFSDLHPGDLLFFVRDDKVYHVAMYLGEGCYIHAPQEGDVVKVSSLDEFTPSFARRIVETRPTEVQQPVAAPPVVKRADVKDFPAERDPLARLMTPFVVEQAKASRFL